MAYEALIERIKQLSEPTIEKMSPEVMARLTHNFDEPLVRQMLYTVTTNFEQRKVIRYIMKAFQSWKKNTNASYLPVGLLPRVYEYPEYMKDLQMDIECEMVITEKGTFSENPTRLRVYLIPQGGGPIKPLQKKSQSALPTNEGKGMPAVLASDKTIQNEHIAKLEAELGEARKTIKSLQEEADHWKVELAAYKERQQNRAGINRLQTAHFGLIVAPMLGINVTNKKALAPMLSKLFGWGQRSMEQQLCNYISKEDEMEVAKAFSDLSPELAAKFCSAFQGNPEEDTEAPPAD